MALPNYRNSWLRQGFTEDELADGGSDRFIDAMVLWGDADAVRRGLREHFTAGATHVCLQPVHADGGAAAGIVGLPGLPHRPLDVEQDRAPGQARRIRPKGSAEWEDVSGGGIDPGIPYEAVLPSGRRIAVFFYDGPTSRAVAFEEDQWVGGVLTFGDAYDVELDGSTSRSA